MAEAIFSVPNNTIRFADDVPPTGSSWSRSHAGRPGAYYRDVITESDEPEADVVGVLRAAEADVLVSYCRSGRGGREVLRAVRDRRGRGLRELPPCVHRFRPRVGRKFGEAGVPIVGDDIKSQVGATITHRMLAKLFEDRGAELVARTS